MFALSLRNSLPEQYCSEWDQFFGKKFRNPKIAIEVGLDSMFYIVLLGNVKRSDCLIISCYCIEGKGSHDVFSLFTPPWPWSAESSISLTRGHNSALFTYISTTRSASNVQVTSIWRITFLTYHDLLLFDYISNFYLRSNQEFSFF